MSERVHFMVDYDLTEPENVQTVLWLTQGEALCGVRDGQAWVDFLVEEADQQTVDRVEGVLRSIPDLQIINKEIMNTPG